MSKIGKKKILIPKEVNVSVNDGIIYIKGPYSSKKIDLDTELFEMKFRMNKEALVRAFKDFINPFEVEDSEYIFSTKLRYDIASPYCGSEHK